MRCGPASEEEIAISGHGLWRLAGALLLIAALLLGAFGLPGNGWESGPPIPASVVVANDDDDDDEDDDKDDEDDNEDEQEVNGQVVSPVPGVPGVNLAASPPELYVAELGGLVRVQVIRPGEIERSGVREGDHVSIDGQRVSDVFLGSDIEVRTRCCPAPRDDDEDDDDD